MTDPSQGAPEVTPDLRLRPERPRVTRLSRKVLIGLGADWEDTHIELPSGWWRNCLTGETLTGGEIALPDVLRRFPVALLARNEG